ncbi:hypothetical protein AB0O76_34595 [Streptomyces sp. NPDC086554]|uniref:hypothetical protein n=1 Tax=Streptomyces sp. NPDC086554 TaxID=3154864 RepID=UPI00343B3DEF
MGYTALLIGVLSDVTGIADLDSNAGIAFLAPGGLFELILPLVLIFRGFRSDRPATHHAGAQRKAATS